MTQFAHQLRWIQPYILTPLNNRESLILALRHLYIIHSKTDAWQRKQWFCVKRYLTLHTAKAKAVCWCCCWNAMLVLLFICSLPHAVEYFGCCWLQWISNDAICYWSDLVGIYTYYNMEISKWTNLQMMSVLVCTCRWACKFRNELNHVDDTTFVKYQLYRSDTTYICSPKLDKIHVETIKLRISLKWHSISLHFFVFVSNRQTVKWQRKRFTYNICLYL